MTRLSMILCVLLFACSVLAEQFELPRINPGDEIVRDPNYTLKYNESCEQPDWVAYRLTPKMFITSVPAKRSNAFKPDPLVPTQSASTQDYTKSGYDRGHLCPAADFRANQEFMDETFYMSNMTPMEHDFNAGNWEALEDLERKWASELGEIFIVDGPILKEEPKAFIGRKNKVAVARRFFKVILDNTSGHQKMIAFIVPHEGGLEDISIYAVEGLIVFRFAAQSSW